MAKVNKVFPSPYNGISEQIPEMMLDTQCLDMVNCVPDLILGLTKRPPAIWVTRIPGLSTGSDPSNGVEISLTGWYSVTINSDSYDDIDRTTISYTGREFIGSNPANHTIDGNLDLQTTGAFGENDYPWFKSRVLDSSHMEADRNENDDSTEGFYRCQLTWNKLTRTWTRTDAQDYWLHPVNRYGNNSLSLGVCTNDPRFLVIVRDEELDTNESGLWPDYPKKGIIWLFAGEFL